MYIFRLNNSKHLTLCKIKYVIFNKYEDIIGTKPK